MSIEKFQQAVQTAVDQPTRKLCLISDGEHDDIAAYSELLLNLKKNKKAEQSIKLNIIIDHGNPNYILGFNKKKELFNKLKETYESDAIKIEIIDGAADKNILVPDAGKQPERHRLSLAQQAAIDEAEEIIGISSSVVLIEWAIKNIQEQKKTAKKSYLITSAGINDVWSRSYLKAHIADIKNELNLPNATEFEIFETLVRGIAEQTAAIQNVDIEKLLKGQTINGFPAHESFKNVDPRLYPAAALILATAATKKDGTQLGNDYAETARTANGNLLSKWGDEIVQQLQKCGNILRDGKQQSMLDAFKADINADSDLTVDEKQLLTKDDDCKDDKSNYDEGKYATYLKAFLGGAKGLQSLKSFKSKAKVCSIIRNLLKEAKHDTSKVNRFSGPVAYAYQILLSDPLTVMLYLAAAGQLPEVVPLTTQIFEQPNDVYATYKELPADSAPPPEANTFWAPAQKGQVNAENYITLQTLRFVQTFAPILIKPETQLREMLKPLLEIDLSTLKLNSDDWETIKRTVAEINSASDIKLEETFKQLQEQATPPQLSNSAFPA